MATGNARRFQELGIVGPLARELAAQITASSGNKFRLIELTMQGQAAAVVAAAVVSHTLSAAQIATMSAAGITGPVITEFKAQIAS